MQGKIKLTRNTAHSLSKIIALLSTNMPAYVKKLGELTESKDEKISMTATIALMDYFKSSVEARDKAELSKLIIKMKIGIAQGGGGSPQQNVPQINFNEIQEI